MKTKLIACGCVALQLLVAGCHSKAPPHATAADVETARRDAEREVAQARAEASKDVKSVSKIAGSSGRDIAYAKATGAFDVAMARAEGDHKIATEKCLALEASLQPACTAQADRDFDTAKNAAKAARLARRQ
jgi:uncharacterized protein (DUF885 family)